MLDDIQTNLLLESLKSGLIKAIESYQNLQRENIPSDTKEFTAYHNASKAALMHIALLIKLIHGNSPSESESETDWITAAREALQANTEPGHDLLFS